MLYFVLPSVLETLHKSDTRFLSPACRAWLKNKKTRNTSVIWQKRTKIIENQRKSTNTTVTEAHGSRKKDRKDIITQLVLLRGPARTSHRHNPTAPSRRRRSCQGAEVMRNWNWNVM